MDEMIRTGLRQDVNASISGSDMENKTSFFVGGGYLKDQGIIRESEFRRYSGRLNLSPHITGLGWKLRHTPYSPNLRRTIPPAKTEYASDVMYFAQAVSP